MSFTETELLKKSVKKWAGEVGLNEAQQRLTRYGISYSLAYLLTTGNYVSEPKDRVIRAIQKAMSK